jgi:membrane-associated phospholipid phosphatase
MIKTFFSGLGGSVVESLRAKSLWWHAAAIALTAVLVLSGFDWWFFEHTRSVWEWMIYAAGIGGFFVPVLVPVALYALGAARRSAELLRASGAVAQAEIIAWTISSIYKAFTGRMQPEFLTQSGVDISRQFHFGFFEHGIFWGWPSSHAAVAVAGVGALIWSFPHSRAVRILAPLYAALVCFGAAVGFHWFSDVVAGTLIAISVAKAVGRNFSRA